MSEISKEKIDALIEILKGHKVWIQTHNFPDPDAIASAFGLQFLLKNYGIFAKICYDGSVDKISVVKMVEYFKIEMFPVEECELSDTDYVVLVDGQKFNSNMLDITGEEVACIDHHPTMKECEYLYKDIRLVGACSSLIAEYIKESGLIPPEEVASALTYGIKMDTDSLNRGVAKLDIAMIDFLYDYTNRTLVRGMYNNNMELNDLRAYGMAINNIDIYKYLGIAYLPFECEDGLIAMVSDFILKLEAVTVAVIFGEKQGGLKFSVRSEVDNIHAGNLTIKALTEIGSGGGHPTMAGGFIPAEKRLSTIDEDIYRIKNRFIEELNI